MEVGALASPSGNSAEKRARRAFLVIVRVQKPRSERF